MIKGIKNILHFIFGMWSQGKISVFHYVIIIEPIKNKYHFEISISELLNIFVIGNVVKTFYLEILGDELISIEEIIKKEKEVNNE